MVARGAGKRKRGSTNAKVPVTQRLDAACFVIQKCFRGEVSALPYKPVCLGKDGIAESGRGMPVNFKTGSTTVYSKPLAQ